MQAYNQPDSKLDTTELFFQANDGEQHETALAAAIALTDYSQKHEGCIAYDVFQSATRPGIFMICETWTDAAALDKHSSAPEFKKHPPMMHPCGQMKVETRKSVENIKRRKAFVVPIADAAQVALRWLTRRGVVAIPKSSHKERMAQNFDIFDFTLTAGDDGRRRQALLQDMEYGGFCRQDCRQAEARRQRHHRLDGIGFTA